MEADSTGHFCYPDTLDHGPLHRAASQPSSDGWLMLPTYKCLSVLDWHAHAMWFMSACCPQILHLTVNVGSACSSMAGFGKDPATR